MQETLTPVGSTPDQDKFYRFLFENAQQNIIILSAAATTAGGQLKPNERGFFGNKIYENINGITYEYAVTPT